MNKKRYIIVGSYGSSNIGDEALLDVILEKLKDECVYVLTGDIKDTLSRHSSVTDASLHMPFGVRSFFSFKWLKSLKLIKAADVAVLGGGGLFTDMRTRKAVLLWAWQIFWFKAYRKKILMVGNSVGPLDTKIGRAVTKWAIKQCDAISVRDNASFGLVNELLGSVSDKLRPRVIQGADLAFCYVAPGTNDVTLDPAPQGHFLGYASPHPESHRSKTIAINLRPWATMPEGIEQLIKNKIADSYVVKLIAMEHADSQVLKKYKSKYCKLVTPSSYKALLKELNTCEYAVGMRLHFLIAAAISGCKIVAIAYSKKVSEVMGQIEVKCIDIKRGKKNKLEQLISTSTKAKNLSEQVVNVKKTLTLF